MTRTLSFASLLFVVGCAQAGMDPSGGSRQKNVINGDDDPGDTSVVALFAAPPGATRGSLCTATVISPRTLLTAAHCVDPAVVGSGNVFTAFVGPSLSTTATRLAVAETHFDPAFDVNDLHNGHDVGVAILADAVDLAPIPYNTSPLSSADAGASVRIVGYGANDHAGNGGGSKRQATVLIDGVSDLLVQLGSTDSQTCHGDSGGPALMNLDGQETIIGLTSYGNDYKSGNFSYECYGGGYDTRVDRYQDFIAQYLY